MPQAITFRRTGGPEVLSFEDFDLPDPGDADLRVRHTAIGLNFIDTYYRAGLYSPPGGLPFIPGNEAAGVVTAVGRNVTAFKVGDRVAYGNITGGGYATERNIPADKVVKIAATVDDKVAAATMLKGMTAQYLLRQTFRVEKGHTVLVHAAAGGVGQIAVQWARHLGATVIGTVGSKEKADLALKLGCHHVIQYRDEDFAVRVAEITSGAKCDVVYDGVGKATFPGSLDCLKQRGMFVSFGNASGAVDAFSILILMQKGSLYCTRPTLAHYATSPGKMREMAEELMDVISSGAVKVEVNQTYQLAEAARAHRDLEQRRTVGSTVLLP